MLERHGPPSKLDHAKRGTKLKVELQPGTFDLYVQISLNEEDPEWNYIGNFDEESYLFYMNSHKEI